MSANVMDFTKLMGNVYSDLDIEFNTMHTREELERHLETLKKAVTNNKKSEKELVDSLIIGLYIKLTRMIEDCIEEFIIPDEFDLSQIYTAFRKEISKLKKNDTSYKAELSKIKHVYENRILDCFDYLSKCIDRTVSADELDKIFVKKIEDKYLSSKIPASENYLTRIVCRRLSKISPEFVCIKGKKGENTDSEGYVINKDNERIIKDDLPSVKLLILKQFIKVFGWGEGVADTDEARRGKPICSSELKEYIDKKYGGSSKKASIGIDETVFSEFKDAKHKGLFLIAERLGEGGFEEEQSIREDIYIFSIAFQMTFSSNNKRNITENDDDYETDIRKNLFFDYYCENLFNFDLDKKSNRKNSGDVKNIERSSRRKYIPGYGPNYRNFIEMIYIYFIGRDDLSELQKLQKAKAMIRYCQSHGHKSGVDETYDEDLLLNKTTEYYRKTAFAEIKNLNDDKFRSYILENFVCGVENLIEFDNAPVRRTIPKMNIGAAHETAAEFYSELLFDYKKESEGIKLTQKKVSISFDKENNKLYNLMERFNDLCENEKVLRRWYISLDGINGWSLNLQNTYNDSQLREGILEYNDKFVVNRTDLEVLLSDYAVIKFSQMSIDMQKEISGNFKSFYDYLSEKMTFDVLGTEYVGMSSVLIACGYQEICSKNIFDILIIYLTYKKIFV